MGEAVAALGALLEAVQTDVQTALPEGRLHEDSEAGPAASPEEQAGADVAADGFAGCSAGLVPGPGVQRHSEDGDRELQHRTAGVPEHRVRDEDEERFLRLQERRAAPEEQGTQPGAAFSAEAGLPEGVVPGDEHRERPWEEGAAGQGPGGAGASLLRSEVPRTVAASGRLDAPGTGAAPWRRGVGAAGVPRERAQQSQGSWVRWGEKQGGM